MRVVVIAAGIAPFGLWFEPAAARAFCQIAGVQNKRRLARSLRRRRANRRRTVRAVDRTRSRVRLKLEWGGRAGKLPESHRSNTRNFDRTVPDPSRSPRGRWSEAHRCNGADRARRGGVARRSPAVTRRGGWSAIHPQPAGHFGELKR